MKRLLPIIIWVTVLSLAVWAPGLCVAKRKTDRSSAAAEPTKSYLPSQANPALAEATRKVAHQPSDSPSKRLTEFNTLRYAFIDPITREVSFIGIYDPAYASGPIPYADLLTEALEHPYPSFSLDEELAKPALQAIRSLFDKEMELVSTNLEYGVQWMRNILLAVFQSKEPIPEKVVINRHLKQLGIKPQEFEAYLNFSLGSKESKESFTDEEQYYLVRNFMAKMFASVGIEERYGEALITMAMIQQLMERDEENYEMLEELSGLLGVTEEMQRIRSERAANSINEDTAARRLYGLLFGSLLKGMGIPAKQVDGMVERFRKSPQSGERLVAEELVDAINKRQKTLIKEALQQHVLKSFILTQYSLKRLYPSLPTIYSGVKLYGMRADSPLARAMFEADYALKYVTTLNPDTTALPEHLSSSEFLSAAAERLGRSNELKEGAIRFWIRPGKLKLEPLADGSGVRFSSATVRINVEPLDEASKKKAWLMQILSEYENIPNKQYDNYARLYPSLHTIREVEKVLALARWIKQNRLQVKLPNPSPVANPVPERVEGFVELVYVRKATGTTDDVFIHAKGGVDFGPREGNNDGIEVVSPSSVTTKDVLEQLVASAALAQKAADAALDGNMEAARELAEKSAEAMTGEITTTKLTGLVPIPSSAGIEAAAMAIPLATRVNFSQKVIDVLDQNLKAITNASSQAQSAESLRITSPQEYQRLMAASKELESSLRDNLRHLQVLLILYNLKPIQIPEAMPYVMEDLNSLEPLKPIAVSTETKLKIKDLFKDLHQDIGYKLKDAQEKIKNAELKKEDAAVKLKSLQARAITAKPEEKQEIDKLLAEAQVLLQRAEDELAKAKQRESELLKEKERVENEIKNMETKMQAGGN